MPGHQPQRSGWATADHCTFSEFPGESDRVAEMCQPAWDSCPKNCFLQGCLLGSPRPSRCRHLLTEVLCWMSEHFTTSFLQNSKKQEFNLNIAKQLLMEQSSGFLSGLCSEADLRSSVRSGRFLQVCPGPTSDSPCERPAPPGRT